MIASTLVEDLFYVYGPRYTVGTTGYTRDCLPLVSTMAFSWYVFSDRKGLLCKVHVVYKISGKAI